MSSGSVAILLADKQKLSIECSASSRAITAARSCAAKGDILESFLRVPPFPGARLKSLTKVKSPSASREQISVAIKQARVGGAYWAAQPALPPKYVLVMSIAAVPSASDIANKHPVVLWDRNGDGGASSADLVVTGECDPWHMLQNASALVGEPGDELRIIAGLLEVPCFGRDGAGGKLVTADVDAPQVLADQFAETAFENPFTGEPMAPLEAVALCSFWRDLIDSNRDIAAGPASRSGSKLMWRRFCGTVRRRLSLCAALRASGRARRLPFGVRRFPAK